MQRLLILILALLVAGCAAPPPKEDIGAPAPPAIAKIGEIDLDKPTKARLINDEGEAIKVGDSLESVIKVFPKDKGIGFKDVPATLDPNRFDVWGWQAKDGSGFGSIVDKPTKRVAAAMRTLVDLGQTELDTIVMRYQREFGEASNKPIEGKAGKYYFWGFENAHRVMICAVSNQKGGYRVTIAMGDSKVMDAIDASDEAAEVSITKADRILESKNSPPKPG